MGFSVARVRPAVESRGRESCCSPSEQGLIAGGGGESPMRHHSAVSALTLPHVTAADRTLAKATKSPENLTLATLSAAAL